MIGKNKFTDIEENGIYVAKGKSSDDKYIFKLNGKKGYTECIFDNKGYYNYFGSNNYLWEGYYIEKATELEKAWLLECVKQNKFVPLEKIELPQNKWLWTI